MINLVFSPVWFYGYDIIFEALAVVVTLLIAFYSYRFFRFSKIDGHRRLAIAFVAIALSLMAKIATNFVLYYQRSVKQSLEGMIVKYNLLPKSHSFFQAGYDIHRFLMLIGLLIIFILVSKSQSRDMHWLFGFTLLIVSLLSFNAYYIFHLTAALMLLFIIKYYFIRCQDMNKKKASVRLNAHLNFFAFVFLMASHLIFSFVWVNIALYVAAEIIQLIGFVIFLVNLLLLVLRHGKKAHTN